MSMMDISNECACVSGCTCSERGRAPEAPGFFMCRHHAADPSIALRCAISLSTDVIARITQRDMAGCLWSTSPWNAHTHTLQPSTVQTNSSSLVFYCFGSCTMKWVACKYVTEAALHEELHWCTWTLLPHLKIDECHNHNISEYFWTVNLLVHHFKTNKNL